MNPSGGSDSSSESTSAHEQSITFAALNTGPIVGNLDSDPATTQALIDTQEREGQVERRVRAETRQRVRLLKFAVLSMLLFIGLTLVILRHNASTHTLDSTNADAGSRYPITSIPLTQIAGNTSALSAQNQSLSVNGQLNVNNSIVIAPTRQPNGAVIGQLYYDQTTNQLSYYNGKQFATLLSGNQNIVSGLGGASGAIGTGSGLAVSGNSLSNTGVLSLQGQTGNITLTGGPGIEVNGTTLSNSGVLSLGGQGGNIALGPGLSVNGGTLNARVGSLSAATNNVTVTDQGNGNWTIGVSVSGGSGAGTVASTGGTVGKLAYFAGVQDIEDSIVSESGSTVMIGGSLQVSGGATLGTPLAIGSGGTGSASAAGARTNLGAAASGSNSDITSLSGLTTALSVSQGGTGLSALTGNELLYASSSSIVGQLNNGTTGQCLVSNGSGSAPSFQTCTGAGGVSSLDSLTGSITLANSSGVAGTITIDNAKADGTTKGIAAFNSTNFTASGGVINTVQNIAVTSAPTFGQLSLNSSQAAGTMLTVNNTNAAATGNLINLELNGTSELSVSPVGNLNLSGTVNGQTIGSSSSFTGGVSVGGTLNVNTISPTSALAVGVGSQSFTLQGNVSSAIKATNGTSTTTVDFQSPTANVTYNFATAVAGSYDICTTVGNCAGTGGGVTTSGGTANTLAKFTASGSIGNSIITDNGSTVTIGGTLSVNTLTPTAALTVGSASQNLTLQGAAVSLTDKAGSSTNSLVFGVPSGVNKTITLPNASGTVAVSASGPLSLDASGNLTCPSCLTSGGGGGTAGVSSVNSATGALTLQGTDAGSITTVGTTITVNDATSSTKGLASFNSTDLTVTNGNVDTVQSIAVTATPQFAGLSLTSALTIGNGGTGATTQSGARTNLGAAASGANSDITSLSGLTTALSVLQGGTGASSLTANGVLIGNGTSPVTAATGSNGQCLVIVTGTPVFASCPGSGGVSSVDGLSGALTINNSTGVGSAITINNAAADGITKGIAAFNSTNFTASGGVINTVQNINTGATPTFNGLNLSTALGVGSGGTGLSTLSADGILYASGTSTIGQLGVGTSGQCLISNGAGLAPTFQLCPGASGSSVTTSGGTNGTLAMFTSSSNIADSIITQSSTTITIAGTLNLSNALTVANGGTGLSALTANQILYASGTSAVGQLGYGTLGQCLTSNGAGNAPIWQTCPGASGSGVSSLDTLTGNLTISNTTGSVNTITINNAKADGSTKGIATFNSTNFTDNGLGVINTVQGIATTSTPTFASLTLSSALTIANGGTGATSASGARTNLGAAASGANSDITSLSGLTTALSVSQGGTGLSALTSFGILYASNTSTIGQLGLGTSGQCLISNGSGTAPTFQTCTGAGGVSSLDSLTGSITLANSSGVAGTITIDNAKADGSTKGIAAFNSTNFKDNGSGVINTIQDITTSSAPAFGQLSLSSSQATGTMLSVNNTNVAATGNLLNLQLNGSSKLSVNPAGSLALSGTVNGQTIGSSSSFTGGVSVGGTLNVNTIAPTSALTVGVGGQSFTLQGNASSAITATNGTNTTTVDFQSPTANVTYNFATAVAGSYNICTTAGNCAGVGGGVTTPGGTVNTLAKFTASGTIGNSIITDDGSTVTVGGTLAVNTITPTTALTVGSASQNLTLQGAAVSLTDKAGSTTNSLVFGTPSGTGKTITLPNASGTVAVSASGPLALDAAGNLTCPSCLTSGGGGGTAGVSSVNSATGALTLQGSSVGSVSTVGTTITINDASSSTKGLASFNSTDFTVTAGNVDTVQGIATTSTPTFASLTLSSALTIANGGTGATSASGARTNLGAAASGANSDITSLSGLTTALSVSQGGTGLSALTANELLFASSTSGISQLGNGTTGQCLVSNGAGSAPSFQTCSGVSSIDGLTGSITLDNSSGLAGHITIANAAADGSTKGIAAFNSTNFTAASGVINTVQNIATTSSPQFAGLSVTGTLNVNTISPTAALTIGSTSQAFTIQGTGTSAITANGGGGTTTIGFTGTPTGAVNYNFDRSTAPGTYTICTSIGNCAGAGGGITGSGTSGKLALFNGTGTITSSDVTDTAGSNITIGSGVSLTTQGSAQFKNAANSTTAFQVQNAAGNSMFTGSTVTTNLVSTSTLTGSTATNWSAKGTATVSGDTANGFEGQASIKAVATATTSGMQTTAFTAGIGGNTQYQVTFYAKCNSSISTFTYGRQDVSGTDINATTSATCNTNWQQYTFHYTTGATITSPNLYMDSGTTASVTIWVDGVSLVQTTTSAATNYAPGTVYLNGVVANPAVFQNTANSINAFQVQTATGSDVLNVDTTDGRVGVNTSSPGYAFDVNGNINTSTGYLIGGNNINTAGTLNNVAYLNANQTFTGTNAVQVTSTTAFVVQNASSGTLLGVDTSGNIVNVGATGTTALAGTVNIATSTGAAQTVHIGDGATETSTITIGSANSNTATTLQGDGITAKLTGATSNPSFVVKASTASSGAFQVQNSSSLAILNVDTGSKIVTVNGSGSSFVINMQASGQENGILFQTSSSTTGEVGISGGAGQIITQASSGDLSLKSTAGKILLAAGGTNAEVTVDTNGNTTFKNVSDSSTNSFQVQNAAGTNLISVNTTGKTVNIGATGTDVLASVVNIGTSTGTGQTVTVGSAVSSSTTTIQGGTGGVQIAAASGNAINIGTSVADNVTIGFASGTSPVVFQGSGISQTLTGSAITPSDVIKTSTNSTTAFQIQNSSGIAMLSADTSANVLTLGNKTVTVGQGLAGSLAFADGTTTNRALTINTATLSNSWTLSLPATGGSGTQCLQSTSGSTTSATTLTFASCGSSSTTLQQAYNNSAGASPSIDMTSTNKGFTIQNDNTSPITGELFGVHDKTASGLGASLFSVANTGDTSVTSNDTTGTALTDTANGITTGNALSVSANGLTTGNGINIATTSALQTAGSLLNVSDTATLSTLSGTMSGSLINVSRSLTANVTGGGGTATPTLDTLGSGPEALGSSATVDWPNSYTVGNHTNRYLLVTITDTDCALANGDVTYGTSNVALINSFDSLSGFAGQCTYFFGLAAPAVGTATLDVNDSNTDIFDMVVSSWYNVNQSTPIDAFSGTSGTTFSASLSATSASGEVIVDMLADAATITTTPIATQSGQTRMAFHTDATGAQVQIGGSYRSASAGTTTMSWGSIADYSQSPASYAWTESAVGLIGSIIPNTETVSSPVASISNNCNITAGSCTDATNVLSLNQQYSGATGAVLNIQNAGTGDMLDMTAGSTLTTSISGSGAAMFKTTAASANAFQILDNSGNNMFNVNSSTGTVTILKNAQYNTSSAGACGTNYNFTLADNLTSPTDAVRWRDNSCGANLESGGTNFYISGFSNASYTGSQDIFLLGNISNGYIYVGDGTGNGNNGLTSATALVLDNSGSAPSSGEVDGGMYYDTSTKSFFCGQGGSWYGCTGVVRSITSTAGPEGSTSELSFGKTWTAPKNDCQPGVVYHITASGYVAATGSNFTLTFHLQDGSTDLVAAAPLVGTASMWNADIYMTCRSTTSVMVSGDVFSQYNSGGVGANGGNFQPFVATSPATIANGTGGDAYGLSVQWSSSPGFGNGAYETQFTVQRLGAP